LHFATEANYKKACGELMPLEKERERERERGRE